MCNWKSWIIPGLLAVALLTAFAALLRVAPVETDLATRAQKALSEKHGWASVKLDGRDLTLTGTAPSPEAAAAALELATDTYGVRIANSASELLPVGDPYVLSMDYTGDKLALAGNLPNSEAQEALAAALGQALPGVEITGTTTLARGAPEGFGDLAGFAASLLGSLSSGTASISGTELTITGVAKSIEAFDAVKAALAAALPGGGKLARGEIAPAVADPYTFAASRIDGAVSLTGFIPDEQLRGVLLAAAATAVPGAAIDDKLQLASGAPEAFPALAKFAVDSLASLKNGSIALSANELTLTGLAASAEALESLAKSTAAAVAAGGKIVLMEIKQPETAKKEAPKPAKKEPVKAPEPVKPAPEPKPAVIELPAMPSAAGQIAGSAPVVPQAKAPEPAPAPAATAVAVEDCQNTIDEVLTGETIQFEKGSAEISDVSLPLLDKLVAAAG